MKEMEGISWSSLVIIIGYLIISQFLDAIISIYYCHFSSMHFIIYALHCRPPQSKILYVVTDLEIDCTKVVLKPSCCWIDFTVFSYRTELLDAFLVIFIRYC